MISALSFVSMMDNGGELGLLGGTDALADTATRRLFGPVFAGSKVIQIIRRLRRSGMEKERASCLGTLTSEHVRKG
jgi:hypothetical protein